MAMPYDPNPPVFHMWKRRMFSRFFFGGFDTFFSAGGDQTDTCSDGKAHQRKEHTILEFH